MSVRHPQGTSHAFLVLRAESGAVIGYGELLQAGYMDNYVLHATEHGTPQGGSISPVLANLALDGLDGRLRQQYPLRGKGSDKAIAASLLMEQVIAPRSCSIAALLALDQP